MYVRARLLVVATLVVTISLFGFATGVTQALTVDLPLARVTRLSPRVVVADVESIKAVGVSSRESGRLKTIKTVVRLKVVDQIKGAGARWITVTVPGGRIGDVGLVVEDAAQFTPGMHCIVFLDGRGGVTGWHQGVLRVVDGQVVELDRPLASVARGIRAAAGGAQPRLLEPIAKDAHPAGFAPRMPTALPLPPNPPSISTRAHSDLLNDGFEGSWGWTTSGSPTWANTTYKNNGGANSAYCAQGGTGAVPAPGPYPSTINAWMYKTVNLSDATIAVLDFDVWFAMGGGGGWFCLLSTDGSSWGTVGGYGGSTGGWWHWSVDLRNAAAAGGGTRNYCGQSTVYIAFVAQDMSAGSSAEGAYMDNVTLWKDTVAVPSITSMTPTSGSAGTDTHVTIAGTNFGASQGTGSVQFFYRNSTTIAAPVTSWSDTSIDCTIPIDIINSYPASAGSGPVKVIDNNGNWNAPYSYTVTFGYGGVQWASPGLTYRYNANTSDIANEIALYDAAVATWFPWSAFTFTKGATCTTSTYPPSASDGFNDVYWAASGLPAGALAVNAYWYSGSTITESDIAFNDAFTWSDGAVSGAYDVQTVAIHESGHSLNLRDQYGPGDTGDIMYGSTASNSTKRSLSPDDQAGVLWIYGPASTGTMGVNNGALYTNNTAVTLNSSATASQMHFRDQGGSYGGWEAYGASRAWTLPAGDGVKTVEAQYQNAAGKYFSTSDAITLDQTAPSTSDNSDGLPHVVITLTLSPSDTLSGVAATEYRVDGGSWVGGTSVVLRHAIRHKRGGYTRGAHTIEYRSTDNAGNVESVRSRVVTLS